MIHHSTLGLAAPIFPADPKIPASEMPYYPSNPGKKPAIVSNGNIFLRLPVHTRLITIGDDLAQILREYALPQLQSGDLLCISEKVVSLCQRRVIPRKDIHPGFWANLLCRFVHRTPAGPGAGTPHKMQLCIMQCTLPRVLFAAFCAAITKPLGFKGVFYRVCGHQVGAIDGLVDQDISFASYYHYGILAPANPEKVCQWAESILGIPCAIVDACDYHVEIMGLSPTSPYSRDQLQEILRDNPAGQGGETTPFVLVRPIS